MSYEVGAATTKVKTREVMSYKVGTATMKSEAK